MRSRESHGDDQDLRKRTLAIANEEAMYCPSSARFAVWVPSLTVSVPPLLPLFIQ
jgi:hypothetical protein